MGRPFTRGAYRLLHYYLRGCHNVTALNACTLPREGPALLVCNHISGLDPPILQAACPRLITWLMAKEYYEVRAMRWFFRRISVITVERSGRDLAATRAAMRALSGGQVVGIFPEGRLAATGDLQPFQTGVALVAIKAGVPVYPACIEGTACGAGMLEAFLYRQEVRVAFGQAVQFSRSDTSRVMIESATAAIHAAVLALRQKLREPCGAC